jgi:hypothetical protein
MINGTTAPPMIPVLRIPANGPWCSETEFRASDTSTGHIIEANSPMAGNAINDTAPRPKQCSRQAQQRADGETDQHSAAIEQFEQPHAQEASGRQHSPEPGDGARARGMRIVAVILGEKFRDPIGGSLLASHVSKDAQEECPHHGLAQQAAIHLERTRGFVTAVRSTRGTRVKPSTAIISIVNTAKIQYIEAQGSAGGVILPKSPTEDCPQWACPGSRRDRSRFVGWRMTRCRKSTAQTRS